MSPKSYPIFIWTSKKDFEPIEKKIQKYFDLWLLGDEYALLNCLHNINCNVFVIYPNKT